MFGLLRPDLRGVPRRDAEEFQGSYCNLCGCLAKSHGTTARLLTVFDFASLAWLLHVDVESERPRPRLNCVRGGSRGELRPVDRFLADLSAFTSRVKVEDDVADECSWRSRLASWTFSRPFRRAGASLGATGFDVGALQSVLDEQHDVESRWESDLAVASEPTGRAYAMVAQHLVDLSGAPVSADLAAAIGDVLGRCVFLVDARSDFGADARRNAYNPLRMKGSNVESLPETREAQLRLMLAEWLVAVDTRVAAECPTIAPRWVALRDRVLGMLGLTRTSVVLNCGYFFPCGGGGAHVDGNDCSEAFGFFLCVCCIVPVCSTCSGSG